MAKSKAAAGPSVEELVSGALVAIAIAEAPVRLAGKGEHPAIFSSTSGANKDALAKLKEADPPLVEVAGKGKAETVRLTAAGFQHVLPQLPEEKVGDSAKALAGDLPAAARAEFLDDIVKRSPAAAAALLPMLEEAIAAEKAEQEAKLAAVTKRREAEEATRKALEQWLALQQLQREQRLNALTRELLAEGGKVPEMPQPAPAPEGNHKPAVLKPASADDAAFRRQVARRLVSSWLEAVEANKAEAKQYLETAIWNVSGFKPVGEAGEQVAFDGALHESDDGVSTGSPVRVERPGWLLEEEDGRDYLVLPARVKRGA